MQRSKFTGSVDKTHRNNFHLCFNHYLIFLDFFEYLRFLFISYEHNFGSAWKCLDKNWRTSNIQSAPQSFEISKCSKLNSFNFDCGQIQQSNEREKRLAKKKNRNRKSRIIQKDHFLFPNFLSASKTYDLFS